MFQSLSHIFLAPTRSPAFTPTQLSALVSPLWHIGITSLCPLVSHRTDGSFIKPNTCLDCFGTSRQTTFIRAAKLALKRLTLLLTGTPYSVISIYLYRYHDIFSTGSTSAFYPRPPISHHHPTRYPSPPSSSNMFSSSQNVPKILQLLHGQGG